MKTKIRKYAKALVAGVLSLALVLEAFSGLTFVSEATDSQYTELTFSDWGIADNETGESLGSQTTPVNTLNGSAFTGIVKFAGGGDSDLRIGGSVIDSHGIQIFYDTDNKCLQMGLINTEGAYIQWNSLSDSEVGFSMLNTEFKLRMTFDVVDTTSMKIGMYVNDKKITDVTFSHADTLSVLGTKLLTRLAVAKSVKEYHELTFADWGIADGEIASDGVSGTTPDGLTTFDSTAFTGTVTFGTGDGQGFRIGGKESDWHGIHVYYKDRELYFAPYKDGVLQSYNFSISETTEMPLTGVPIKVRMEFDYKETTYDVKVYLNDTHQETFSFPESLLELGTGFIVQGTTVVSVYPEYETMAFTDFSAFGESPKTVSGGEYADVPTDTTKLNFSGVTLEDWISFSENAEQSAFLYVGSKSGSNWQGLRLYQDSSDLHVQYQIPGTSMVETLATISNKSAGIVNGEQFKLKLGFAYRYGQDVMIRIFVKDKLWKTTIRKGIAQNLFNGIFVYSATDTTVVLGEMTELPYDKYQELIPKNFGFYDTTYVGGTDQHTRKALESGGELHETYLNMDVTITDSDGYLVYVSDNGWRGIQFGLASGELFFRNGSKPADKITFSGDDIASGKPMNLKIYTKLGEVNTDDTRDVTLKVIVNNTYSKEYTFEGVVGTGNELAVNPGSTGSIRIGNPVTETITKDRVSYDLENGDYLVLQGNATYAIGDVISTPGDYEFERIKDGVKTVYPVSLYKVGDVNLDGTAGDSADLAALEALLGEASGAIAVTAAQLGADLDNDNVVGSSDLALMKEIVNRTNTIANVRDIYYVPAMSYDYLGGDEVMPIVGYYGPYNRNGQDFTTDDIMQAIKESGVNLVNYSHNAWGETSDNAEVLGVLAQHDKYGIGYFVDDWNLNAKVDHSVSGSWNPISEEPTAKEIAEQLSNYSFYQAFLGSHIVDEPKNSDLDNYTTIAKALNQYVNTNAFVNLFPEDAGSTYVGESYGAYWDNYISGANPKLLSVDDYPFNDKAEEGVTKATGYFTSLATVRAKAQAANNGEGIPFWYYVQAGGSFKKQNGFLWSQTNKELIATEEETYWNVNTALAYGAKGIEWFTLLQTPEFATNDSTIGATTYDYERNGLIGANVLEVGIEKAKTPIYDYAVNANKQIAAVDEVLMKADSIGVIATGGYAESQTTDADVNANISVSDTKHLSKVEADDSTYGALIGCFDYKGSEAYYVVNYNVTADTMQNVTLTFDKEYNYRTIDADGSASSKGSACTMTIPAGKAVLVVLDSPVVYQDPVEIYPIDFGIADGTYTNLEESILVGNYTPIVKGNAAKTLDGTILSVDLTLNGTGRICYGGAYSGGTCGVNLSQDTRPGYENGLLLTAVGYPEGNMLTPLRPDAFKTDTLMGKDFNLKISTELVDHNGNDVLDLKLGIYINDILFSDNLYWDDYEESLGTYFGIYTEAKGDSVIIKNPTLDLEKYDAITTTDLGMAPATYTPADFTGRYSGESLDGVVFSANVDFKNTDANYIRFGGMDGHEWDALSLTRWNTGQLVLQTTSVLATGYATDDTQLIAGNVTGLDHLRISVDYVDFDRDGKKDDVKLGVWLNGAMYNNQYFYYIDLAPYFGNNIVFHAPLYIEETQKVKRDVFGEFTVLAAPLTKTQEEAAYDLTKGAYTLPGTEVTYSTPGDYSVEYTDLGTTYTGNVALYYEGDATMDGKVDVRDLIRNKKDYTELTLSDAGITKETVLSARDTKSNPFANITSLNGVAITGTYTFPTNDDQSYIRIGGKNSDWHGLSICYLPSKEVLELKDAEGIRGQCEVSSEEAGGIELAGTPITLRLTFEHAGADMKVGIYINGNYCKTFTIEDGVGNMVTDQGVVHCLVHASESDFTVAPVAKNEKSRLRSMDVDNDGEKTDADAAALRTLLAGGQVEKETVFGVISDIHLLGDGNELERQKRYEAALNYYKKNGAEVIIMNSDITDHGEPGAYQALVQIANEVYKDTPEAERPQFVTTADNHEYYDAWNWNSYIGAHTWADMQTRFYNGLKDLDTELRDGALNTSRTINGYTFIGVSSDKSNAGPADYSDTTLEWLENALAKAAQDNPDKPIFVAIHQPVKNTVSSSDGADGVEAYEGIVGKYPQVVLFTSHTHAPLADEHSIWQGPTNLSTFEGTVVNTGGVHDVGGLGRTGQGDTVSFANVDATDTTSEIYTYGNILLVRANGKKVDIQRYNVLTNEPIKDNWVISDVFDTENREFTLARFEGENKPSEPTFNGGVNISYNSTTGVLSFNAATSEDFVYYYEIKVGNTTKNYVTTFYQGIPQMDTVCSFNIGSVESGTTITITAVDAYQSKSSSVSYTVQ